ncbi:glucan biosynthesis protein [Aurantimonas aggregata]
MPNSWWRRPHLYVGRSPLSTGAPTTSMYMRGEAVGRSVSDFRPQIDDSEALWIRAGSNDWLLRPLRNPKVIWTFRRNGLDVE